MQQQKRFQFEALAEVVRLGNERAVLAITRENPIFASADYPYVELRHFSTVREVDDGLCLVTGEVPAWLLQAVVRGQVFYKGHQALFNEAHPDLGLLEVFWFWVSLRNNRPTGNLSIVDRVGNVWRLGCRRGVYFVDAVGMPWNPAGPDQEPIGDIRLVVTDEDGETTDVRLWQYLAYGGGRDELVIVDDADQVWHYRRDWIARAVIGE